MRTSAIPVSVVTINLNNAAGLETTIQSVIEQTWKPLEFIVIDGGSTDESKGLLHRYASHISYSLSEPDKGIYDAQNKGLNEATGKYVIFLNAGDWFFNKHSVELLMQHTSSGREIVFGNLMLQDQSGKLTKREFPWPLPPHFFDYDTLPQCICLVPTQLMKSRGGLNANLKICADWQLFREIVFAHAAKILHAPEAFAVFDTGGISGMAHNQEKIEEERQLIRNKERTPKAKWVGRLDRLAAKCNIWLPRW